MAYKTELARMLILRRDFVVVRSRSENSPKILQNLRKIKKILLQILSKSVAGMVEWFFRWKIQDFWKKMGKFFFVGLFRRVVLELLTNNGGLFVHRWISGVLLRFSWNSFWGFWGYGWICNGLDWNRCYRHWHNLNLCNVLGNESSDLKNNSLFFFKCDINRWFWNDLHQRIVEFSLSVD